MRKPNPGEGVAARLARGFGSECARPEGEVLSRGQRAFERVQMAEIMGLLTDGALGVAALEREAAGLNGKEATERAQESRFAGAVGACHHQGRTLIHHERKA